MKVVIKTPSKNEHRLLRLKLLALHPFCYWCEQVGVKKLLNINNSNLDHVLPKSRMPKGFRGRKVLSCIECNDKKKDMWPKQWKKVQALGA